ncbi:helix-turn-helix transcriptional regulator [Gryllotalpicola ginsengisoli]|uniref:helix-turn-helix transcriptional regulator n=1 Tax=Gryllotalpicola ginsengisoli TaxID=444608 RepID=UPI0003B48699|nr:WYL domain-containing protein [Gryllotalpicola ginsengisoli]
MPRIIPPEERQFSLVLALLATEHGLTKEQILSTVDGYAQKYDPDGPNANLERQFERDKDALRELGLPLETVDPPGEPGNNQLQRYRIPKGDYELPGDVTFTPTELGLLQLAGAVWREGTLSGDSRRALIKLRALGVEPDGVMLGYAPRLRALEPAFAPLTEAIERHEIVTFPYLRPGRTSARPHTIKPLAVFQFRGRWLFQGLDHADRPLTFLLSRIVGEVKGTKTYFEPPAGDQAARAVADLQRVWDRQTATVEVVPGSDAAARLGRRFGGDDPEATVLTVHYSDLALLADELAGYGPEALVIEPEHLKQAVVSRLEAILWQHAEAEGAA